MTAARNSPPRPWAGRRLLQLLRRAEVRRVVLLLVVGVLSTLLVLDYVRMPDTGYQVGDVASHDVKAPIDFRYVDTRLTRELQEQAAEAVPPVFDYDLSLVGRLQDKVSRAFERARERLAARSEASRAAGFEAPTDEDRAEAAKTFVETLGCALDASDLDYLARRGFDPALERQVKEILGSAMRHYVVADRSLLPPAPRYAVERHSAAGTAEEVLEDPDEVVTPEDVRQEISLHLLDSAGRDDGDLRVAAAIARAMVRPNFTYDGAATEQRRQQAREAVAVVVHQVKRGTTLLRAGDVVEARHVEMLDALRNATRGKGFWGQFFSLLALNLLVEVVFYLFGAGFLPGFARDAATLEAQGFILLLVLGLARLVEDASVALFPTGGGGPEPSSFLYLVPLAGGAMLVRTLANSQTAFLFAVVASLFAGMMMERQVFYALFFLLSSLAAVGGIVQTRERLNILRAGVQAAVVNTALVVLLDLVDLNAGVAPALSLGRVFWDVLFAAVGGLVSAVLVLGLIPFFELFGFVTDYKLLELSNLNHPLLKQLMLRAPGTYHHSVVVGNLAEAAAEAIGANSIALRVGAYFHDIGKVVKPHYFVENQRDAPNPHDSLPPQRSAAILINHVRDGLDLAREHRLPRPVLEAISTHHGTGLIVYFYEKARREAPDPSLVDPADFRYPGPRPSTREAGILFLADKVEAACRAAGNPSRERVREIIQDVTNATMNDGQFENCPLTLKDLYTIARTFEEVLLGIYHHRVEYPKGLGTTRDEDEGPVITLEIQNPAARREAEE